MLEALTAYFISQAITIVWFYSPLKSSIMNFLLKKEEYYSSEDFDNFLIFKNKYLGKLFSCVFCFSFWISLIVTLAITYDKSLLSICLVFSFCIVLNNIYNTLHNLWTTKK